MEFTSQCAEHNQISKCEFKFHIDGMIIWGAIAVILIIKVARYFGGKNENSRRSKSG